MYIGRLEVRINSGDVMLDSSGQIIRDAQGDQKGNLRKSLFISKLITKLKNNEKKNKNISGLTLVEILIGIVVSSLMMGAIYTTYL